MLRDTGGNVEFYLDFNRKHKKMGKRFWAGMDVGFTNHPSEILIFAESPAKKGEDPHLTLLTRIHMERLSHPAQVDAIVHCIKEYGLSAFAMDKTGLGLPLFSDLQTRYPEYAKIIKGYNFSEKILTGFDSTIEVDEDFGDPIAETAMMKNVLQYSSDVLRDFVDNERITLPWDSELIGEFQGQTYTIIKDNMNIYGKKTFSGGSFHALDAARMAVLGYVQHITDQIAANMKEPDEPVLDIFLY